MRMTKKELSQLYWLNREIEMDTDRLRELDYEIKRDEDRLARLELQASSISSPAYDGMPKAPSNSSSVENSAVAILDLRDIISRKKALRSDCAMTIQAKQTLCLTERYRLERYIADMPDSLCRMVFTYRFINGLTWRQVSECIGMRTTEDSVKKLCYRYLGEENKSQKQVCPECP